MARKFLLGDRVRQAREVRKMSQRELSDASGLHKSHIPLIEGGERPNISVPTVEALAKALNVSVGWLVNGEGEGPFAKTGS